MPGTLKRTAEEEATDSRHPKRVRPTDNTVLEQVPPPSRVEKTRTHRRGEGRLAEAEPQRTNGYRTPEGTVYYSWPSLSREDAGEPLQMSPDQTDQTASSHDLPHPRALAAGVASATVTSPTVSRSAAGGSSKPAASSSRTASRHAGIGHPPATARRAARAPVIQHQTRLQDAGPSVT